MSRHTEVPGLDADFPGRDFNPDVESVPAAPRGQFGRLALWVASASALTAGVVGTVAYGMWFDDDQRIYAEAITSARQALRIVGATSPVPPNVQYGHVTLAPAPVQVAAADLAVPGTAGQTAQSGQATQPAGPAPDTASPRLAAAHPERATCAVPPPPRRHPQARAKPSGGVFAGMNSFFHRTSYPQHGPGSQRDIYARP